MVKPSDKLDREAKHWYVMRCHNRSLNKVRRMFVDKGQEIYVPETYVMKVENGKKVKKLQPVFSDIVFVKDSYNELRRLIDREGFPIIFYYSHTSHIKDDAIWVNDKEMDVFIKASYMHDRAPEIRRFGEIDLKKGDRVRVIDGPLESAEGFYVQVKRGQKKQLVFVLENAITVNLSVREEDLLEILKKKK